MKRKSLITLSCAAVLGTCLSINLNATPVNNHYKPHFYIGSLLGSSNGHYSIYAFNNMHNDTIENGVVNNSGFGQQLMIGYQINSNIAIETEYTHFAEISGTDLTHTDEHNVVKEMSGTISQQALGLSGKFIYPLANEVNLYGKLGIAGLRTSWKTSKKYSDTINKVAPSFGLGTGFNVTKQFAVDMAYNRIQPKAGKVKPVDLFGVSFYYQF